MKSVVKSSKLSTGSIQFSTRWRQLSVDPLGNAGDYAGVADLSAFVNGTSHTLYVRATNALGLTTERSARFAYQSGFTLVSDTGAPGHARDPQIAQDANGVVHVVWKDDCTQFASAPSRDGPVLPPLTSSTETLMEIAGARSPRSQRRPVTS